MAGATTSPARGSRWPVYGPAPTATSSPTSSRSIRSRARRCSTASRSRCGRPERSRFVRSRAETTAVRPLRAADLADADRIMRLAFGTFLSLPNPASFMGDADYVRTRWRADPDAAFAAESAGELVGSNFATHWGSVGFFGPLSVRPELWNRGVAKQLMEPVMDSFARREVAHAGLFTFAHSQKHVGLYQKFGFWPRFLTAILSRPVRRANGGPTDWTRFSQVPGSDRASLLERCRRLTDRIYEGLDVGAEIRAVAGQGLGDTALLWDEGELDEGELAGFAVCHC